MTTLFESMTSAGTSNSSSTPSLDLLEDSLDINSSSKENAATDGKSDGNAAPLMPQKTATSSEVDDSQGRADEIQRSSRVNSGITAVRNEDNYGNGEQDSALQYQYTAVAAASDHGGGTAPGTYSVADPHSQIPSMRVVHVNVDQNQAVNSSAVHINNATANVAYSLGNGATAAAAANVANVFQTADSNPTVQQVSTVTVDNQGDGSRYTYFPAVQTSEGNQQPGPFYVMVSPQDMIPVSGASVTPPRIIAPRAHSIAGMGDANTFALDSSEQAMPVEFRKVESGRSSRDERRRATHNEVERRRRDKINTWITKLATVVPDCQLEQAKQGQMKRQDETVKSKGGILSKTVDYILKLRQNNERLTDAVKEHENIIAENRVLRQQNEDLRRENSLLHANLHIAAQDQVDPTQDATMES